MAQSMPNIALWYFDVAGRADSTRLAFHIGGVSFEDKRVSLDEWPKLKDETPLGELPMIEIDGKRVGQSGACFIYAGKLSGLYPTDCPFTLAKIHEILGAVEDIQQFFAPSREIQDPHQRAESRAELVKPDGRVGMYLQKLNKVIEKNNSPGHTVGESMTIADLQLSFLAEFLTSGSFEGVPENLFASFENIRKVIEVFNSDPKVEDWKNKHRPKQLQKH